MKNLVLFASALSTLMLAACSASLKGAGGGEGVSPQSVSGPTLDGEWVSDCMRNPLGAYRAWTLTIKGADFQHTEKTYSDSACTTQNAASKDLRGTFRYTKDLGGSVYRVEYRIPLNANVAAIREQNVSLQGDELKVGEFIVGFDDERGSRDVSITLHRVVGQGSASNPAKPSPVQAVGPLQSGSYRSTDVSSACDLSVSTMTVDGAVRAVYIDFRSPCAATTAQFDCEGQTCHGGYLNLDLVDAKTFKMRGSQFTATYKKQ